MSKSHKNAPSTSPAKVVEAAAKLDEITTIPAPAPAPTPVTTVAVREPITALAQPTPAVTTHTVRFTFWPWFAVTKAWLDLIERQSSFWLEPGIVGAGELMRFARGFNSEGIGAMRTMVRNTERLLQLSA